MYPTRTLSDLARCRLHCVPAVPFVLFRQRCRSHASVSGKPHQTKCNKITHTMLFLTGSSELAGWRANWWCINRISANLGLVRILRLLYGSHLDTALLSVVVVSVGFSALLSIVLVRSRFICWRRGRVRWHRLIVIGAVRTIVVGIFLLRRHEASTVHGRLAPATSASSAQTALNRVSA